MKDVVIVSGCRTAIGAFGGTLRDLNGATLASITMKEAVRRAGIDPALIDDIRYGCCMESADTLNVTRVGSLLAGFPETVTAVTVNRVCISGMEAAISGMAMIQAGMADIILAGGTEHMSSVPYSVPAARWGCRLQDQGFVDNLIHALHCGSHIIPHPEDGPVDASKPPLSLFVGKPYIMGQTAEFIAQHLDITREEMDEVALRSHNEAERATQDGSFALSADIRTMPVEPSLMPLELPAVTVPISGTKAGGSLRSISMVMPGRKCSSLSKISGGFFLWGTSTGTISSVKEPSWVARSASLWLLSATSSISSRFIPRCWAMNSAVCPMM